MSTETLTDWLLRQVAANAAEAGLIHDLGCSIHEGFAGERGECDCGEPDSVLARCDADRRMVELLMADTHDTCEDPWYTCAAATEERDGGSTCRDDVGTDCECGRDYRLDRYVRLLALPFADRPGYLEEWRP